MPLRALLVMIAIAVVVLAVRRLLAGRQPHRRTLKQSGKMVQCAVCGMYVPETEALGSAGRHYCSQAHLEEDRRRS